MLAQAAQAMSVVDVPGAVSIEWTLQNLCCGNDGASQILPKAGIAEVSDSSLASHHAEARSADDLSPPKDGTSEPHEASQAEAAPDAQVFQ
ncbi:hypothetical protein ABBQ38_001999 [Trebouxia sp. C0009 RCD-2024]